MSRSSPGTDHDDDSPPQPAHGFRLERLTPPPSADLMITTRAKRSTAGNRLKALLDQELEKDEIFAEVENDIDFEAKEDEDGVDIVDSDFDRSSDDGAIAGGAGGDDDESEGERELEAQEKLEKQRRRQQQAKNIVGIRRPPPPSSAAGRPARKQTSMSNIVKTASGSGERDPKKRRITFASDEPISSGGPSTPTTPAEGTRRTSSRSTTRQITQQVNSRLSEAQEKRSLLAPKIAPKKKAKLTQDTLIAEALEVEEENRASLKKFLEQEEERRAKQRLRKERIQGPFVRWVSVGLRTKVVLDDEKDKPDENRHTNDPRPDTTASGNSITKASQPEPRTQELQPHSTTAETSPEKDKQTEGDAVSNGSKEREANLTPASVAAQPRSDAATREHDGKGDVAESTGTSADEPSKTDTSPQKTDAKDSQEDEAIPSARQLPDPDVSRNQPSDLAKGTSAAAAEPKTPADPKLSTSPVSRPMETSSTDMTLDPVLEARKKAAEQRGAAMPSRTKAVESNDGDPVSATTSDVTTQHSKGEAFELQSRTILSIERQPEDWEWLDEFNTLFGSHVAWDRFPFVVSRNRPLRPRQSICPITGLPAIYKDPRTGIPYANAYGYKVITQLLQNQYIWTSGGTSAPGGNGMNVAEESEKGKGKKKQEKENQKEGQREKQTTTMTTKGKIGTGAVPPEMGIWLDHEAEKGPGGVWDVARLRRNERRKTHHDPTSLQQSSSSSTPSSSKKANGKSTNSSDQLNTPSSSTPTLTNKNDKDKNGKAANPPNPPNPPKPKAKSKPHFEVVLTNALAPGDEASVMAAALQLPSGSTRSGRRVQRPT